MNTLRPQSQIAPSEAVQKRWKVGTLTYTSAGLAVLFGWLLWGDFAWNIKERAVVPVAQLMLKNFTASDFIIGLLIGSLPAALGMILGPIVSVKSDRHRGRWGRRIPFLFIPIPIAVLSMVGLAFTPSAGITIHGFLGHNSPSPFTVNLLVFSLFWTVFEVATIVANSVFGGLINDVVPQELIGRFFGLFRAVSLLAGIIFNFWIVGHAENHYFEIFIGIGLVYGIGFMLMCFKIKEGSYPPTEIPVQNEKSHPILEIKTYLRECYSNSYYIWLFSGFTLGMMACGPVNAFSVFYAKSLGLSIDHYGKYIALTYAISLTISYFIGVLADRFHPLRMGIVATALYMVSMVWAGFFAKTAETFALALILHGVLSGMFLTCTASLGQRLFPRLKFAQFASANGIFGALGFLVMPVIVGLLLDLSGHAYHYTFFAGGILALAALAALLMVHSKFMKLGGPRHYIAPE